MAEIGRKELAEITGRKELAEITVIVPVYNVEEYLPRCIDSIISQSFRDFDMILVDDGSPDKCGEICEAYTKRDQRLHVIHQKNGGLSAARNAGIEWSFANSNSNWLTFIDSDDWVHPLYLEALLAAVTELQTKLAVCDFVRSDGDKLPVADNYTFELWKPKDFYLEYLTNATVSWGKLIKKTCFKDIRFPVGKIHEDEFTSYRILFQLDRISFVRQPLYAYYQNFGGIIRGKWTPARLAHLEALEIQIAFFEKKELYEIARRRFFSLLHSNLYNQNKVRESEDLNEQEKRKMVYSLKKQLRRVIIRYRKHRWLPFKGNIWNKDAYSNAFFAIRISRKIWGSIKRFLIKP